MVIASDEITGRHDKDVIVLMKIFVSFSIYHGKLCV